MSEDEAQEIFDGLDTDHDGCLTKQEFISAVRNFFLSDDPDVLGNLIFGRT